MLDKIAMIAMLILYIFMALVTLCMYLIIREVNENKTEGERQIEDEEQMNYIKNYKSRRKNGGTSN